MSTENEELVRAIAQRFPAVRPLLDEHIEFYEEILPHVFFGDFTPYVLSLFAVVHEKDRAGARQELSDILDFLEQAFTANRGDNQELISVSFLENLPWENGGHLEILAMLGPNLSKQLMVIVDWRPDTDNHEK